MAAKVKQQQEKLPDLVKAKRELRGFLEFVEDWYGLYLEARYQLEHAIDDSGNDLLPRNYWDSAQYQQIEHVGCYCAALIAGVAEDGKPMLLPYIGHQPWECQRLFYAELRKRHVSEETLDYFAAEYDKLLDRIRNGQNDEREARRKLKQAMSMFLDKSRGLNVQGRKVSARDGATLKNRP